MNILNRWSSLKMCLKTTFRRDVITKKQKTRLLMRILSLSLFLFLFSSPYTRYCFVIEPLWFSCICHGSKWPLQCTEKNNSSVHKACAGCFKLTAVDAAHSVPRRDRSWNRKTMFATAVYWYAADTQHAVASADIMQPRYHGIAGINLSVRCRA